MTVEQLTRVRPTSISLFTHYILTGQILPAISFAVKPKPTEPKTPDKTAITQ